MFICTANWMSWGAGIKVFILSTEREVFVMFIVGNFVLEKMQLLYQFTEEHLYDTIWNAEQFSIHGGDKAFFVIRSLVPFHLVLLKHKKIEMSDFHKLSCFSLKKKKMLLGLVSWRTFLFCPCHRYLLHCTCCYRSIYNYVIFLWKKSRVPLICTPHHWEENVTTR